MSFSPPLSKRARQPGIHTRQTQVVAQLKPQKWPIDEIRRLLLHRGVHYDRKLIMRVPIRDQDEAVHTVRGQIRVATVIVGVNYAKVPKKRPKLCARTIRERDGSRGQYTGRMLRPDEDSLDHVVSRSRGGKDAWENLVWSAKEVNQKKADRLPHEAGLKLLSNPRAPKELPAMAFISNSLDVADWRLFLED